jgi:hypothetical protein
MLGQGIAVWRKKVSADLSQGTNGVLFRPLRMCLKDLLEFCGAPCCVWNFSGKLPQHAVVRDKQMGSPYGTA